MKYVKISGMHVKFLLEHLEFMRVNVEPVYIGPLMRLSSAANSGMGNRGNDASRGAFAVWE
jgi:hypothetical protein